MEVSVLSKFLLRIAKDFKFHQYIIANETFKLSLYDINFVSLMNIKQKGGFYKEFVEKINELFDTTYYVKESLAYDRNIVINNIYDYEKLCSFLDTNGFMWGSNRRLIKHCPFNREHNPSDLYLKLYFNECRVYYGHSISHSRSDVVMSEYEFYNYYNGYKKRMNDLFYKCLKKDYGIFKKK